MLTKNNVILKMYGGVLDFLLCILFIVNLVIAEEKCDSNDLSTKPCPTNHICTVENVCKCLNGYIKVNDTYCTIAPSNSSSNPPTPSSLIDGPGNGVLVAWILIPLVVIIIVIAGVFAFKRYKVLTWVRQKINQRNNNYDEFMIGQDLDDDDDDSPLH